MAQFVLYRNLDAATRRHYPCFLDVQHPLLDDLHTRLVAPMGRPGDFRPIERLNPVFETEEGPLVMLAQQLTTVPSSALKAPLESLEMHRAAILSAIDFLITGI